MRTPILASLVLLAPLAVAGASSSTEEYVVGAGGPTAWAHACLAGVNVGAACFELEGWEVGAHLDLDDAVTFFPVARWHALSAEFLPLASGTSCKVMPSLPEGSAYLVADFDPRPLISIIPECQMAHAGTITAFFH